MRAVLTKTTTPIGKIIVACLLLALFATIFIFTTARAADSDQPRNGRLITVHDRGGQKVFLTKAPTVQQALQEAAINLDDNDTVEPSLDEKLVATDYTVNIYRARPVMVDDGMIKQKIMTSYQTADQIAKDAGVELHDEDKTTMRMSDDMTIDGAGVTLYIDRATPFTLVLYGKKMTAYSQSATVAEMLRTKNITLAADDTLSVKSTDPLTAGMTVEIWRNGKQTITEDQEIAFDTEKIQDTDREVGYREVKTPGEKGKKTVSFEIEMRNGQEVSRKEIQSVVTQQPKKQVEVVGAKPVFSGSFGDALSKLRACESGGNYANKNNPSYRGAYQYSYSTWGNKFGIRDPADASPAQQDQAAWETYQKRGWQPWPHCGSTLPDTYR